MRKKQNQNSSYQEDAFQNINEYLGEEEGDNQDFDDFQDFYNQDDFENIQDPELQKQKEKAKKKEYYVKRSRPKRIAQKISRIKENF